MEHSYDDILLLERYMEHSLNADEVRQVERRMEEEPGFKELYQNEKLLVNGIRYGHLKDRLEALKETEASLPNVNLKTAETIWFKAHWQPLAAAASVVLLVTTFLLWNQHKEPQELYAQYFQPYPNIIETIRRGEARQNQRADAFSAYENGNYQAAIRGFNALLKIKAEPGIQLLLGNAYLKLDNTSEALAIFITLSKDSGDLKRPAKWYMCMCYLKMANKAAARVLLEEMATEHSSYQGKARELLKKLD